MFIFEKIRELLTNLQRQSWHLNDAVLLGSKDDLISFWNIFLGFDQIAASKLIFNFEQVNVREV